LKRNDEATVSSKDLDENESKQPAENLQESDESVLKRQSSNRYNNNNNNNNNNNSLKMHCKSFLKGTR
jgi:hypothetical protein